MEYQVWWCGGGGAHRDTPEGKQSLLHAHSLTNNDKNRVCNKNKRHFIDTVLNFFFFFFFFCNSITKGFAPHA